MNALPSFSVISRGLWKGKGPCCKKSLNYINKASAACRDASGFSVSVFCFSDQIEPGQMIRQKESWL
jgi:hypothetical protein